MCEKGKTYLNLILNSPCVKNVDTFIFPCADSSWRNFNYYWDSYGSPPVAPSSSSSMVVFMLLTVAGAAGTTELEFVVTIIIIDVKWEKMGKIAINRPCIINLGRIHEKLFKLSCPQVNVNADADADDAELQLQKPTLFNKIKRRAKNVNFSCIFNPKSAKVQHLIIYTPSYVSLPRLK